MADTHITVRSWLISELASGLSSVFETMTGERPASELTPGVEVPSGEGLWWRQPFSGVAGDLWMFTPAESSDAAARLVLQAAGMEANDLETSKSTYLETVNQAISSFAQAMSGRMEREVTPANGSEQPGAPADLRWDSITLTFASAAVTIYAAPTAELCAQWNDPASAPAAVAALPQPPEPDQDTAGFAKSKTFGLLLEVELPVSVSFGRAQIPLKDVLKLTTGSIIELNRSISEPVEVIVNNCVIARGEVVVVEGNFGIRIKHVVSRQERLRTLH